MKTLYLVRHAKSSWRNPEWDDLERPLLEKGIKRCRKIMALLPDKMAAPDLILSSPAVRALQTARIIAGTLHYDPSRIRVDRTLYYGDADRIRNLFFDLPAEARSVMLIGHNPSMTNLANMFLNDHLEWLPVSAILALRFKTSDWLKALNTPATVVFYLDASFLKKTDSE